MGYSEDAFKMNYKRCSATGMRSCRVQTIKQPASEKHRVNLCKTTKEKKKCDNSFVLCCFQASAILHMQRLVSQIQIIDLLHGFA